MQFKDESYQPCPHIASGLHKFPNDNLSIKQISQFLRILNYIKDFIPHLTKKMAPLRALLKKNPLPWLEE